ncbi:10 kDa chaperonin [Candidatus Hodgkinia cicadicola]|uniref:10 kDa chaperonin n=1 Tax=Candidatus Hodgkinia cicadicola TaxID=573658 RepID=A0ABX4MJN4_9HYPH|nr:10 kDa chaperonin [Candidatus Hodgkinia cicadicola]PIM95974.1 10 kDa chaperonin [Candidatus Hodgkinia cicadicola]PIM96202.1 10 kDa chaperonin [Candidatus Hodgkinia cicadicola]
MLIVSFNKTIITPIVKTKLTSKGVIIPNSNDSKLCVGVVISSNSELKTGDKVLYIRTENLCYNLNSLEVDIVNTSDVVVLFRTSCTEWD